MRLTSLSHAQEAVCALDGMLRIGRDTSSCISPQLVSFSLGRRDTLFPKVPYPLRRLLRIDPVAAFSVTDQATADEMTSIIRSLATNLWALPSNSNTQTDEERRTRTTSLLPLSITDGTACCGGNTISFLSAFEQVTAVELDEERYEDLVHNLRVMGHLPDHLPSLSDARLPSIFPPVECSKGARVSGQSFVNFNFCW